MLQLPKLFFTRLVFIIVSVYCYTAGLFSAQAQTIQSNSPYSKIGVGTVQPTQFAVNRALGGMAAAYHSPLNINHNNPASYAHLMLTTYEVGVHGQGVWLQSGDVTAKSGTGNLSYMAFAFPVTKWWTTGFGLLPYSRLNYDIERFIIAPETTTDTTRYRFLGRGQFYQVYFGNGFKYKNIAIGANLAYLFGTETSEVRSWTPFLTNSYGNQRLEYLAPKGFLYDFGAQYDIKLPRDLRLTLGISGRPAIKLQATRDFIWRRVEVYSNGSVTVRDTVTQSDSQDAPVQMPSRLTGGISIGKSGYWLFGIDLNTEKWADFRYLGQADPLLTNEMGIKMGVEVTPDPRTLTKMWRATHYRFGFSYQTGRLYIDEQALKTLSFSFGVGVPIRKLSSRINLSLEAGQTGKSEGNIIRETFFVGTVGLSLNDRWFIKPKFD